MNLLIQIYLRCYADHACRYFSYFCAQASFILHVSFHICILMLSPMFMFLACYSNIQCNYKRQVVVEIENDRQLPRKENEISETSAPLADALSFQAEKHIIFLK